MKSCNHKVPTVYTSEVRKWQSSESTKKWQKIWQGLHEKHMHIFRLWRKHVQSCKKFSIKLYEELSSRGSHCLYIEGEKWLSSQCEKSKKNNVHVCLALRKLTSLSQSHASVEATSVPQISLALLQGKYSTPSCNTYCKNDIWVVTNWKIK